jgi:hypothetical protein
MRQHDIAKAIGGGLLGTLVQTLMVYGVAPVLGGQSIHVAVLRAHACAPGMLAHLLSGCVLFPLGYLWLSSQVFSGPPVLQGMLWAGLLWCTAEVIMAPLLGAGVFSPALGGFPAALLALAGYLVYGATLGSIAGAPVSEGWQTAGAPTAAPPSCGLSPRVCPRPGRGLAEPWRRWQRESAPQPGNTKAEGQCWCATAYGRKPHDAP